MNTAEGLFPDFASSFKLVERGYFLYDARLSPKDTSSLTEMATANSYTILLVEDDPNDVLLIQRAFKTANINFPIQIVTDGEAAIAYLTETKAEADHERYPQPVLVLLDLHLPRKSGFEVLEWLRQQPRWRRLPVVILTSSAESGGINHAYELGANTYLVKPVRFEDLVVLVRTLHLYWLILSEKPDVGSEFEKPIS